MLSMGPLPTGTVTMLFSDIEGSTALLTRLGDRYVEALDGQRQVLRAAWSAWDGAEMGTEGDSFFVVFGVASHAVGAALQAQRDLISYPWPEGARVAVRMGVHTGEPTRHDDGYVGMDVHRAARVAATAHGGQVVMSEATAHLVSDRLDEARVLDLGRHRLKDIPEPEHLFQLCAPGLPEQFPPLKSLGTSASLPRASTPLVGRDRELADLVGLAASPEVRLVTLTGPGGSGKTRLATAVAAELAPSYSDGAYFVPLAAVTSEDAMWSSIAELLGAATENRPKERFLEWVSAGQALLVLDNLEQLPAAAVVISELLAAGDGLGVVATSRGPLHLQGEHEYPVPTLALPDADDLAVAEGSAAVQLFCEYARHVRPDFALTSDNVAAVVSLCQRLDGLPLAIELAAARLRMLSPSALLARLDKATDLVARDVNRPERQRTLRAAMAWSHELLSPDLQTVFRRLGAFAGGGDLDAVASVACSDIDLDPLDAVAELADAALVSVGDGPDGEPRVTLLQTIRDFALELLDASGEGDLIRHRHAEHYVQVAQAMYSALRGERPLDAEDRLDLEQDNLRNVLAWTLRQGSGDAAVEPERQRLAMQVCHALYYYWLNGQIPEGRRWHTLAVQEVPAAASEAYGTLLLEFAAMVFSDGDYAEAREPIVRSIEIFRALDARSGIISAVRTLGELYTATGDFDAARPALAESLAYARDSEEVDRIGYSLADIGWLEYLSDHPAIAMGHLTEARDRFRQSGNRDWELGCALMLASAQLAAGDLDTAATALNALAQEEVLRHDVEDVCSLIDQYALLAATRSDARLAARLTGFGRERRRTGNVLLAPSDRRYLDRHLEEARRALGAEEWAEAYHEGAGLSLDEALAEAMTKPATSSHEA